MFTKIWHERGVPGPHPYTKFHRYGINVNLQSPKSLRMVIFGINLPVIENPGTHKT